MTDSQFGSRVSVRVRELCVSSGVRARVRTDSFTRIRVRATTLRMHVAQIYELAGNGYPVATADDAIGIRDGLASNGSFASVLSISQWAFSLRIPLASQLRRAAHGFVRVCAHAPSPRLVTSPCTPATVRACVASWLSCVRAVVRVRRVACVCCAQAVRLSTLSRQRLQLSARELRCCTPHSDQLANGRATDRPEWRRPHPVQDSGLPGFAHAAHLRWPLVAHIYSTSGIVAMPDRAVVGGGAQAELFETACGDRARTTYTHTSHAHSRTCVRTHACAHTSKHARRCARTHARTRRTHTRTRTHTYTRMHTHACTHASVFVLLLRSVDNSS